MAQRRMFSLQIVDTDAFMDMPLSSQALYFHLGMRADDDGFIGNARRVQRLVGASEDDFKILLAKRFILMFENGVIVITHWKLSNYIQKDRYHPTIYREEKARLFLTQDGVYTDLPTEGATPCIPPASDVPAMDEPAETTAEVSTAESPETTEISAEIMPAEPAALSDFEPVSTLDTSCIHRLGKDRLGKGSLGKDNLSSSGGGDACVRERTERVVTEYLEERSTYLPSYFGMTEDALHEAELFAISIFKRWTSRMPTQNDIVCVYLAIQFPRQDPQTQAWSVTFPQNKRDLLMYAFEAASNAGKPGDWNYIQGILGNLHKRNIQTLEQADDYDRERVCKRAGW